eukprot:2212644-Amphidinium_carterae.1
MVFEPAWKQIVTQKLSCVRQNLAAELNDVPKPWRGEGFDGFGRGSRLQGYFGEAQSICVDSAGDKSMNGPFGTLWKGCNQSAPKGIKHKPELPPNRKSQNSSREADNLKKEV